MRVNWTPEEIQVFHKNPTTSVKNLQTLLPRHGYWAIRTKKARLGLFRQAKMAGARLAINGLTEFDRGFLVGILEGEGFLSIALEANAGRPTFRPSLGVEMTDGEIPTRFLQLLGVGYVTIKKPYKEHRSTLYRYTVNDRACIKLILESIKGCLVSERKRNAAELMIEFCSLRPKVRWAVKRPPTTREIEIFHGFKQYSLKGVPIRNKHYSNLLALTHGIKPFAGRVYK